jgi:hypothetical protein
VAPSGYVLLPEEPKVLWEKAAEREVALNRLMPLGPFGPNVSWDELPQACMAMDAEHWGLLGNSRWVQRGKPRGFGDHLLELDDQWDLAVAAEPVEGQPKPPLRTKLDGWVTVLCLFAGIGAKLEGLLKAGIRVRKLLVVEIDPVARRILEYRVCCLHRRYPDQLPAVACEGLLTAMPADIRLVRGTELERFMPIHVVTVSSPCQGLSRANRSGRGLADARSGLIADAFRILMYQSRHQDTKPTPLKWWTPTTTPAKTPGTALRSSTEWLGGLSTRPSSLTPPSWGPPHTASGPSGPTPPHRGPSSRGTGSSTGSG